MKQIGDSVQVKVEDDKHRWTVDAKPSQMVIYTDGHVSVIDTDAAFAICKPHEINTAVILKQLQQMVKRDVGQR